MEDSVAVESRKNDIAEDKLRWDLLPLSLIKEIVKVFHFGAKKICSEYMAES